MLPKKFAKVDAATADGFLILMFGINMKITRVIESCIASILAPILVTTATNPFVDQATAGKNADRAVSMLNAMLDARRPAILATSHVLGHANIINVFPHVDCPVLACLVIFRALELYHAAIVVLRYAENLVNNRAAAPVSV